MAKPMLVTLPFVLLLLDFWPLNRVQGSGFKVLGCGRIFFEKIPFFALTAASCLITFLAQSQQSSKAVVSFGLVSLNYRLKAVPVAFLEYLWKTFWPAKLAVFYPLPDKIPATQVALAVAILAMISCAAFWRWRTRPYLLMGWLWFLGMLVPVIGLVQVGGAQIADRYSYLPSAGIFIAVTFGALDLAARRRIPRSILAGTSLAVLLALAATTESQLRHWKNDVALFRHSLSVTADNDVARNNLGIALEHQGLLPEAAEQYRAAAGVEPGRYQGHHNLASALDRLGRQDEALAEHREAARLGPDVPFLRYFLGLALLNNGQAGEAFNEFSAAARLDASYPWPHIELAKIYSRQDRDAEAVAELRAAVRIAPDNADILAATAHLLAASENAAVRDGPAAFALAAKANLLTGGARPDVLDVMGMACAEMGKFVEAQMAVQQALDLARAAKMKNLEPIEQRLALYKNHMPWRESFLTTNAPATK